MADKIFKNEKDRGDFFIAIAVIALFGFVLFGKKLFKNNTQKATVVNTAIDSDNDGIADINDKCPNDYGKGKKGCPQDSDNDGVYNYLDQCPNTKGTVENNGCPANVEPTKVDVATTTGVATGVGAAALTNNKKDGKADKKTCEKSCEKCTCKGGKKQCKKNCSKDKKCHKDGEKETPQFRKQDTTIFEMSEPKMNAPKDTDNDGIIDEEDKCPLVPGVASNNGCPVEKVAVKLDEEDKKVITEAVRDVQFKTASDVLLPKSEQILDKIASIMNKYPKASLTISGHTDSDGQDSTNQRLSEKRAASCKAYLTSKGISSDRMTTKGFGESQPIATNSTSAGKRQNRRVEFEFFN